MKVKAGDVIEIKVGRNYAYLQYVGKHTDFGDVVLVNPECGKKVVHGFENSFFDSAFMTFYPIQPAVQAGLAKVVGFLKHPQVPRKVRGQIGPEGSGIVWNGIEQTTKKRLSKEEMQYPVAMIWNHEGFLDLLKKKRNPSDYL